MKPVLYKTNIGRNGYRSGDGMTKLYAVSYKGKVSIYYNGIDFAMTGSLLKSLLVFGIVYISYRIKKLFKR